MARKKKMETDQAPPQDLHVPIRFEELIGHGAHLHFIKRSLERKTLPQSLVLAGPSSVGKMTLARMIAAALQCDDPKPGACGACGPCRKAARCIHPDIREVRPEGFTDSGRERSVIRVPQVRSDIVAPLNLPPYEGKKLVFTIIPADALNEESQNCLLKSLEEPPAYVQFILVTANPSGLLPTVRSRCQEIALQPVPADEMEKAFVAHDVPPEKRPLALALSGGCPGLLDAYKDERLLSQRATLLGLMVEGLEASAFPDLDPGLERLSKEPPRAVIGLALSLARDGIRVAVGLEPRIHRDQSDAFRHAAHARGLGGLQRLADKLAEAPAQLAFNVNARLLYEKIFLVP